MNMFDKITEAHGWISDKDFIWYPFSFLKPEPKKLMSFGLTCQMTLCFGGLTALIYAGYAVANNAFDATTVIQSSLLFFCLYFVWFNLVTRPLWNRRARRLLQK